MGRIRKMLPEPQESGTCLARARAALSCLCCVSPSVSPRNACPPSPTMIEQPQPEKSKAFARASLASSDAGMPFCSPTVACSARQSAALFRQPRLHLAWSAGLPLFSPRDAGPGPRLPSVGIARRASLSFPLWSTFRPVWTH